MNRIVMWLFSQTAIGQFVDGKKTVIGASFILLAKILEALQLVAPMFPNVPWLGAAIVAINQFAAAVAPLCEHLGIAAITVGLIHKQVKAKS